jgi:tRNA splicing ligase
MLEVQKYLNNKTLDDLNNEFAIKTTFHPNLPLVILNYDQIESKPKNHPIVRECRGLVLNSTDWSVAARSFPRFFNWGEVAEEMKDFDFSDFLVQSKEDGSLCLIYNFNGEWLANTRGSFATDLMQHQSFTWQEGFCMAMGVKNLKELDGVLSHHRRCRK